MDARNDIQHWRQYWNSLARSPDSLSSIQRSQNSAAVDIEHVANRMGLNGSQNLADFCCGSGWLTARLKDRCQTAVGIDFSEEMIQRAQSEYPPIPHLQFIQADISHLPFTDETFSAGCCMTSVHYFPDFNYFSRAILEMLRVLKKGSLLLLTDVPIKNSAGYFAWLGMNSYRRWMGQMPESRLWNWHSKKEFRKVIALAGAAQIEFLPTRRKTKLSYRSDVLITK